MVHWYREKSGGWYGWLSDSCCTSVIAKYYTDAGKDGRTDIGKQESRREKI